MRYNYFLCLLLFAHTGLYASGDAEYPINVITDSLKRNAGAVVRADNVTLNIHDIHKYSYSEEKVISILSSSEENLADIVVGYDEQRETIKSFKAWVYDADGKMIKHFNKQDGADYSNTPDFVLIGNERVKYWDLKKVLKPPYTIKYIYETEATGTFQLPEFAPVRETGVSIENAHFTVSCGADVNINYNATHIQDNNTDKHKLQWEVDGCCAIKKHDYFPSLNGLLPRVSVMAKQFELYGFTGRGDTWNDIGVFVNTLMKGREALGPIDDPKLNDIIGATTDSKEKVRLIYKYLQGNFRYVCVALGIGGWQAQEASFTMQKKYGDCKALSMVMKAMLKKAGIESCITLIKADGGHEDLPADFPRPEFNHAILCVPLPNDTIWLECTSPISPFNYLGSHTANRPALMLFDGGARLVRTPVYNENVNTSQCKAQIKLNTDNTISIHAALAKQGELQDDVRWYVNQKDAKNIESSLYASAHLKNTNISSYNITDVEPDIPVISFTLNLADEGTIRKTESRLFVRTDIFMPITSIPEKMEHRIQKVYVNTGYTQSDTLVYTLPNGYIPESFKADDEKEYDTPFGYTKCILKYVAETNELTVIRKFCLKQAIYPADQYSPLREFLSRSLKQCCPELVLKKTE